MLHASYKQALGTEFKLFASLFLGNFRQALNIVMETVFKLLASLWNHMQSLSKLFELHASSKQALIKLKLTLDSLD